MQWIAPHLRYEKGPVATCYPYASFSCPSSQFFARQAGIRLKITGSNKGGALTRSEYPYLTILPSSSCVQYFTVANAPLLSYPVRLAFLRRTRHPSSTFTFVFVFRLRCVQRVRSRDKIDKMRAQSRLPRIQQPSIQ